MAALEDVIADTGSGRPSHDQMAPLRHWLYFHVSYQLGWSGPDGHERPGTFLPDLGNRRRMWAGSRVTFHAQLSVGDEIVRSTRIGSIEEKVGSSGPLIFVRLVHTISGPVGLAITDEQDLVYREPPRRTEKRFTAVECAPGDATWSRRVTPDPVMLFRYSALTYNSHRIHYDQPYATGVEGYPGLVVHGPLLATLMADLARERNPGKTMLGFDFRGVAPVHDTQPFDVCGRPGDQPDKAALWIEQQGSLKMRARCTFAANVS
jgi:3-methylfumaryl-CoA hydratase